MVQLTHTTAAQILEILMGERRAFFADRGNSIPGQQFPLMTRESYMTMVADNSLSVSTIGSRLLK